MRKLFADILDFRNRVEETAELEHQGASGTSLLPDYRGPLVSNTVGCFEVVPDLSKDSHSLTPIQLNLSSTQAGTCWRWVECSKGDEGATFFQVSGFPNHYRKKVELPSYEKVCQDLANAPVVVLEKMAKKLNCELSQVSHLIPSNGRPPRFISSLVNYKTGTVLDGMDYDDLVAIEQAFQKMDAGLASELEDYEKSLLKATARDLEVTLAEIRPQLPKLIKAVRFRGQLLGKKVDDFLQAETDIVDQFMPEPNAISVFPPEFSVHLRKRHHYEKFLSEGAVWQDPLSGELDPETGKIDPKTIKMLKATRQHLNAFWSSEGGDRLFSPLFSGKLTEVPSFREVMKALTKAMKAIQKEYDAWEKLSKLNSRAVSLSWKDTGEDTDRSSEAGSALVLDTEEEMAEEELVLPDSFQPSEMEDSPPLWADVTPLATSWEARPRPGIGSREPSPQALPAQQEWLQKQLAASGTPRSIMAIRAVYGPLACEMPYEKNARGQLSGHPFAYDLDQILSKLNSPRTDYGLGLTNVDSYFSTMRLSQDEKFFQDDKGHEFIVFSPSWVSCSFREMWAELSYLQQYKLEDYVFIYGGREVKDLDAPCVPGFCYIKGVHCRTQKVVEMGPANFEPVAIRSFQKGYILSKKFRRLTKTTGVWDAQVNWVLEIDKQGSQSDALEKAVFELAEKPAPIFMDGDIHYRPFRLVYPLTMAFLLKAMEAYSDGYELEEYFPFQDDMWAELSRHQEQMRLAFLEPLFEGPVDALISQIRPVFQTSKEDLGAQVWGVNGDENFYRAHLTWHKVQVVLDDMKRHLESVIRYAPVSVKGQGLWDDQGNPLKVKKRGASLKAKADAFGLGGGHRNENFQGQLESWLSNSIYASQPRIWEPTLMPYRPVNMGVLGELMTYAKARIYMDLPPLMNRLWDCLDYTCNPTHDIRLAFSRLVSESGRDEDLALKLAAEFMYAVKLSAPMSMARILNGVSAGPFPSQPKPYTRQEWKNYWELKEELKKGPNKERAHELNAACNEFMRYRSSLSKDFKEFHQERLVFSNQNWAKKLVRLKKGLAPYFVTEAVIQLKALRSTLDEDGLERFKTLLSELHKKGTLQSMELQDILG